MAPHAPHALVGGAAGTASASLAVLLTLDDVPVARTLSATGLIAAVIIAFYLALDVRLVKVERNQARIAQLERDQLLLLERIAPSPDDSGSHRVRRMN